MKKQLLTHLLAAALLGAAAVPAAAQNVAVVNGKPVTQARLQALKDQIGQQGRQITPEMEPQLKEWLINREVFLQEANKQGLAKDEAVKKRLELTREDILIEKLFDNYQAKNPASDEEAKAWYDEYVAANAGTEYKSSHILVEDEERAKAIIAEVKGGKSFEDIAKQESKDPGSGSKGGDLGWAKPQSYVPEFSEALTKLEKGGLTQEPVKSQFGWHIIRLDDQRPVEMPKFEDVKAQAAQQAGQQKLVKYQESLREKAKVE